MTYAQYNIVVAVVVAIVTNLHTYIDILTCLCRFPHDDWADFAFTEVDWTAIAQFVPHPEPGSTFFKHRHAHRKAKQAQRIINAFHQRTSTSTNTSADADGHGRRHSRDTEKKEEETLRDEKASVESKQRPDDKDKNVVSADQRRYDALLKMAEDTHVKSLKVTEQTVLLSDMLVSTRFVDCGLGFKLREAIIGSAL